MSNITDFIGGKKYNLLNKQENALIDGYITLIETSKTFIAPFTGKYLLILQGGGGSGAVSPSDGVDISGGASGDVVITYITLTKDESVTVTIGAGGSGVTSGTSGGAINGNSGSPSSFGNYVSTASVSNGGTTDGLNVLEGVVAGYGGAPTLQGGTQQLYNLSGVMNFFGGGYIGQFKGGNGTTSAGGGGSSILANGGNAAYNSSSNATNVSSASAIKGAGSGGAFNARSSYAASSGNGGDGFAVLFYEG